MKTDYFGIIIMGMMIVSCTKGIEPNTKTIDQTPGFADIQVVDGHLSFPTAQSLENYMNAINLAEDAMGTATRSIIVHRRLPGFVSIAERKDDLIKTRASSEECEEMTEEEYEIMMAEKLLIDPLLEEIMNTELVIEVEGRAYKITEVGTFSVDADEIHRLEEIIRQFDTTQVALLKNGESLDLTEGAYFTNTFGRNSVEEDYFTLLEEEDTNYDYDADYHYGEDPLTRASESNTTFKNNFHVGFGTVDYTWAGRSVWQKVWEFIRGKNVIRENSFDDKHRVKASLYNTNYGFYAASGIKVEMQQQKKFLFVKYWVSDTAEELAIGFNKVYGTMKFTNPRNYSLISPTGSSYWSSFTGRIEDITSSFICGITGIEVFKDWVSDLPVFLPLFWFNGKEYPNTETGNKLFDTVSSSVFSWLKSRSGMKVFNIKSGLESLIKPKDPRVAYFVWGNSSVTYNQEKPFAMGVKTYSSRSSKSVVFDRSFGFALNLKNGKWIPNGFVPTEFKIEEIDAFGAAKYKGQWKGVRFIAE